VVSQPAQLPRKSLTSTPAEHFQLTVLWIQNSTATKQGENVMADLDQLKQKYSPVIQTIEGFGDLGAKVDSVSLDGEKLYLKGSVPSEVIANRVWDVIKQVDPTYSDLHHEIATTGGPNQSYSVKSGDNLSKISNRFYGSPNHYSNIATASNIADPNKIQVGQQITVPVLT
jgi:nucleoid-associated protein YgaU